MSIKKSHNGTWMYDVRHPKTKRRKRLSGFTTKAEADQARSILLERWRNELHGTSTMKAQGSVRLNLKDELEFEAKRLKSEAVDFFTQSHDKIAQTIERFARTVVGKNIRVTDLDVEHLDAFVELELARGLKPNTVATYLVHLMIAFRRIRDRSISLSGWKIPKTEVPGSKDSKGKLRRVWTPDEISRVLTVLANPNKYHKRVRSNRSGRLNWLDAYDVLSIAALIGARKSEILMLEWSKVFFEWDVIHFRTLKKRDASAYREIPMIPELKELLLRRREDVRRRYGKEETFVFPKWKKSDNADWLYRVLRQACEVAGVQYGQGEFGVVLHGLRHTAATRMLAEGADIATAADILGHTVSTMLETYAHSTMANKKKAVTSLSLKPGLRLVTTDKEKAA